MLRSMLFVPADSERKLARAAASAADALILDLEDSVMPDRKKAARTMAARYLRERLAACPVWVRVNDLASGELLDDLAAVLPARPAGIVLPKIRGPEEITTVSNYLDALEVAYGISIGSSRLLVLLTETPSAVLRMGELARLSAPRLSAVGWGAEDLSSAIGAGDPRLPGGAWRDMYVHARNQCILAAHALQVDALDTVHVNYKDSAGLQTACVESRHDGFTGRFAIHPDQVPIINRAFTPGPDEVALAHRIVAAFASGSGAVSIEGKMYDLPHLKAAKRLIASNFD